MMDWFDNNAYSHDARTQFMNWSLAGSAAWDYPADTYGYTWGAAAEYHDPAWAVRAAAVAEPRFANQAEIDPDIGRAHGFALEGEHQSPWDGHPGTLRLLLYFNEAHMGSYDQSVALGRRSGAVPDITQTRAYGHAKYGFASSDDLQVTDRLGAFSRLSWDDGRNETWAYDEVDGSAALGLDWTASSWGRPQDHWAVAQVVNVLSNPHRRYLTDGGLGFMLGDGALHYGPEFVTETYYRIQWREWLQVSPDAQFVMNPGYNRARGPIPVWGVRVHVQF
jgi:high affinity Mn2+ porin